MDSQSVPSPDSNADVSDSPLAPMQPGEHVVCEIRRHPVGLVGVYLVAGLVIVAALIVAALVPTFFPDFTPTLKLGIVLVALALIVLTVLYTFVVVTIYKANRWIVTNGSITEITQVGLFNKETSQLSLANLEDVTVDQNSLLQSMLGFGTLRVETAGEHSKFNFAFCPEPNECARKIISAHEAYIANKPDEMKNFNRPINTAHSYNQPGYDQSTNDDNSQSTPEPPAAPLV